MLKDPLSFSHIFVPPVGAVYVHTYAPSYTKKKGQFRFDVGT
jgi:hypothetical protein